MDGRGSGLSAGNSVRRNVFGAYRAGVGSELVWFMAPVTAAVRMIFSIAFAP